MSLSATVLQDAIVSIGKDKKYSDYEQRISEYSIVKAFQENSNQLWPGSTLEAVKKSVRQPVKIPSLNRFDPTIITTRSCTIEPDEQTSAFTAISWSTIGFAVGLTPADHADNYISAADNLANQFRNGFRKCYETFDSNAWAFLEARKATSNDSPLYTLSAGALQVPDTKKIDFYKNLPAVMRRNDLYGRYIDIANTEAIIDPLYLQHQGSGNSENKQYQIQNIDFYRSNRAVTGDGVDETHFNLPAGSIGLLNWLNYEAKNGIKVHDSKGWSKMVDNFLGLEWELYFDHDCADGGFSQKWTVLTTVAFGAQYSSVAGKSSIIKSEILLPA